nr:sporulation protein YunB [Clostridiales bacterium]
MRRKARNIFFKITAVFLTALIIIILADAKISPKIKDIAESKANNMANNIVDEAVSQTLAEENIHYSDLVQINRDNNGKICSVTSDIVLINKLKSKITNKIIQRFMNMEKQRLDIPVGSLIGSEFTAGKGPEIHIDLSLEGSANAEIGNIVCHIVSLAFG